MAAKHFINDPSLLVNSALHALTLTNPSVALDTENKIVYRRPGHAPQVSIISGGGSGHEPSFGAFVGDGLLSAAVAGSIFASPSAEQIRKAVMSRVETEKGVLVTVMNYTGDVLNFGVAVEKAKAAGFNVEMCVVGDDVGVGRTAAGKVGRRGIAGTVLVHKISGALAATGASLKDVYNVAKLTAELVKRMLAQLLDSTDKDRSFLNVNSNEVVLLINNMTSLNGLGFSISILNVVNTNLGGPSMLQLLDAPCEAAGWAAPISKETWEAKSSQIRDDSTSTGEEIKESGLKSDPKVMLDALNEGLKRVVLAEPDITRFDTIVGDGDAGQTILAVLKAISFNKPTGDVVVDVSRIAQVVENSMDGTSGALYAIYLNSLIHGLRQQASEGEATPKVWAAALKQALEALAKYTPAQPGDRTLIDALHPFVETLAKTGSLKEAAEASRSGAEGTKGMKASLGRTVYIGGSGFEQVPDPGAWGLSELFLGIAGVKTAEPDYEII